MRNIYLQRWLALLASSPASNKQKQIIYNDLRSHYRESHRAYHTFEHIKACFYHLDNIILSLENPFCVELALWFHDIIYDPKSASNELDSAEYASVQLQKLNLSTKLIKQVHSLILLTAHPSYPQTSDEKILIDIDLSILGADRAVFDRYERNIRKEYKWVDNQTYRAERAKLLKQFLKQSSIYQTSHFIESQEQQAQKNIQYLLQKL